MDKLLKGLFAGCLLAVTVSSQAACPVAEPVTSPNFCESFRVSTECHCLENHLPRGLCANNNLFYKVMIDTVGTLHRACDVKHIVSIQECIDDWNCYRYGGTSSTGELCSGTGQACA
ncbi:MAG: hypothetical protein NXI01_01135 [Gammaproteobacteria bacterium]|nr:hypothetical protein [Gammaproteobacteria bacterium]